MPALLGTIILIFGTAIVSFRSPSPQRFTWPNMPGDNRLARWIRMAIVNLAGIPSIVYGLFRAGHVRAVPAFGTSIIAGSLTLGIMTMPVVISTAEEAILGRAAAVPHGQPEPGRNPLADDSLPGAAHAMPASSPASSLGLGRASQRPRADPLTVAAFYLPELPRSISIRPWRCLTIWT